MIATARGWAIKGRLGPSFFFACALGCGAVFSGAVGAQQAVFRCGQQYTNVPHDASRCERVAPQAITVIEGTRVQSGARAAAPAASPQAAAPLAASDPGQGSALASVPREDMARQILNTELTQARERHALLLRSMREAEAASPGATGTATHIAHQERLDTLQASLARAQRDIDSLQRELLRRPPPSVAP